MPNDLIKQNLLNLRAEVRLGSRQHIDSKGFFHRGGGVAFVWTLSGVVLAACSTIDEILGLDDDDGGVGGGGSSSGNALHVQRSPVQGARLYFDLDNDGDIDADDVLAQDAVFPEGFVTDATGQARDIPEIFEGLPFKAVLDGAIDAETGTELSGTFDSIADADGQHTIATPITDYIANQQGETPADVVAALLSNPDPDSEEVARLLEAINDPASYLGDDSGIEGLAFFLATETAPTAGAVQSQAALLFNDDPAANDDTLIVVNADTNPDTANVIELPAVTIGVNDSYVATIQAVSHTGAVQYRFVESDGTTPVSGGAFSINAQGVISVVEGQPPTDTTLYVEVSNGDADETEIVSVAITLVSAPSLNALPAGDATATIMEGVAGASDAGTALISGITPAAALTNATWEIDEASPAGLSAIVSNFSIVADATNTGTYTLVLNSGASLDYDAIPGGVLNLHVRVVEDGVRSNALALRIQIEEDPDEIDFGGDVTGIVAEGGNLVAEGSIRVENQPESEDVTVSSPGTYGTLVLGDNGAWTYTLNDALAAVDALLTGQVLIDTATIAVGDVTQNILIRINGLDEDVHFVDSTTSARTATASVGVERGNPVLSEVDIFAGLTLTNADLADIEIDFAETGDVYDLFTITDAGLLTFTGDNDDVAGFGSGITLDLAITAPTLTSATLPFALQVNVINLVDDGRAEYEVIGDVEAGQELGVRIVDDSADPDGVVGGVIFQWFRGDETDPNPTLLSRGDRYSVTQADIDSGDSIGVFAIYTDGSGTTYTHTDGDPATTIVVFASPVSFTAPAAADRTISLPENTLADGTVHFAVTATSEDDGTPVAIASYMLVNDSNVAVTEYRGFTIDADSGDITLTGALDYEDANADGTSISLRVRATDENGETASITLTVNVENVQEGRAEYEITDNNGVLSVALIDADPTSATYSEDPDGVVGGVSFRWFTTTDGGTIKDYITDATSASFTIDDHPLENGEVYGVTITYTDTHDSANGETTEFDVLATPVRFTPPTEMALMASENDAGWMLQLEAESNAGGDMSPIARYEFVDENGDTSQASGIFEIDENTGLITLTRAFDFEDSAPNSYELTVRATDSRAESENNEITFTITVQNVDDGVAQFALSGTVEAGETLAVTETVPDPDGIASINYIWYYEDESVASNADDRFKRLLDENGDPHTGSTYTIPAGTDLTNIAGYAVDIEYTDNSGFEISRDNENAIQLDLSKSTVRFTTLPPASIDVSEAASANYAMLGANNDGILATFTAASSEGEDVTYTFEAFDDEGNAVIGATGLFSVSNGEISLLSNVDYETTPQYTLIITASAPKEANSMEMDTAVARVIFNVVNDQDGPAEYEVTENEAGTMLTVVITGFGDLDIAPDGIPTNAEYRWFTTPDGGTTKNDIVDITDTTSATLDIDGYTPPMGETIGVTVSYQDPLNVAAGTRTEIDILASPIDFTDGTNSVLSYTGSINEDGNSPNLPTVTASVEDAPQSSTYAYAFVTDTGTNTVHLGFTIDSDGMITFTGTAGTDLNYDTDPIRDSIMLTVRATYDSNGTTAGGEVHTRDVDVVIAVTDLNDETPEFAPLRVETDDPQVIAGFGVAEFGSPTSGADTLTGTSADEYINSGAGTDTIASGGGADHILGGAGNDTITLSSAVGSVETVYYRFSSSTDGGNFVATDGFDTIKDFRRGEDKLVLIDTDGTLITLTDFLSDANRESGGNVFVVPLLDSATGTTLIGVQIDFGNTNALRIEYATDSQVANVRATSGGVWETAGDPYVGTNGANIISGGVLNDNTLLLNYFGTGDHDNLLIADDAYLETIVPDVLIAETFTSTSGVFASVSATDADGTSPNNQVSYSITGGTGMGIFEINPTNGGISVASSMALDYDTAPISYTLTIEVSDGTNTATQDITIELTDVNDSDPTATTGGTQTFAERTAVTSDTPTGFFITLADDDTDAVNEHDVEVIGAHASRFGFVEDGTTANQWNLVLLSGQEVDREASYVINGMLTVEYVVKDGTRYTSSPNSVGVAIEDINDNGPTVTASQTDSGTPISLDEAIDDSTTPRNVMGLTIGIDDADVTAGNKSGVLGITPTFRVLLASSKDPIPQFAVVDDGNGNWVLQYTDSPQNPLKSTNQSTFEVIIEVSDGENIATESDPFTITINNLDEGPGVYRVDGNLMVGQTLTVTQVTEDPDGIAGTVSYLWYKQDSLGMRTQLTADTGNPNQYTLKQVDNPDTELFGAIVVYEDDAGIQYDENNNRIDVQFNLAPVITTSATTVTISTNMNRVQDVITVEATDRNTVDTLTYAFVVNGRTTQGTPGGLENLNVAGSGDEGLSGDNAGFSIDANTGRITFSGNLHPTLHDHANSTVTLTVQVSDGTATATVDITVDFLENTGTTTFDTTYTRGEADNFYVGTQLGLGNLALDPDGVVTAFTYNYYRLVESTDPITEETVITEEDAFIQSPGGATAYTVTPEDVGHKILARATYTDGKDNKEVFEHTTAIVVPEPTNASAHVIVSEGVGDDAVLTYATVDGAMNTDSNLSYAITSTIFRIIDATTGAIQLAVGQNLDYETTTSHTLSVTVTDSSDSTTTTHDIIIQVGNINEAPTATPTAGAEVAAITRAVATSSTNAQTSTGYKLKVTDVDGTNFNPTFSITSDATAFTFSAVDGEENVWELFFNANTEIATSTTSLLVGYRVSDGVTTGRGSVKVIVGEAGAPAKIPNRPEPITHDPASPDDDPLAGMAPLPDADPYAG